MPLPQPLTAIGGIPYANRDNPLNFVPPRSKQHDVMLRSTGTGRWSTEAVLELIELPFMSLLARAHAVHAEHFDENAVQRSTLLSIKTGGCSEDCGYCSQSARYDTEVGREALMSKRMSSLRPRRPRRRGLRVSVWVPRGVARRTKIWTRLSIWSSPSRH